MSATIPRASRIVGTSASRFSPAGGPAADAARDRFVQEEAAVEVSSSPPPVLPTSLHRKTLLGVRHAWPWPRQLTEKSAAFRWRRLAYAMQHSPPESRVVR